MVNEKKESSGDEARGIGAIICYGAGIWLIYEGFTMGGIWRVALGALFIAFGLVRGYSMW
jgi:hypothetical protein